MAGRTSRRLGRGSLRCGVGAAATVRAGPGTAPPGGILMALARTLSISLAGVSGRLIEVEADISAGLPGLTFTGLADISVLESRERIRAAVLNSGLDWPNRRV